MFKNTVKAPKIMLLNLRFRTFDFNFEKKVSTLLEIASFLRIFEGKYGQKSKSMRHLEKN